MIKLRPHHLLCIFQFQGYGYNEEFVKNMYSIIGELKNSQLMLCMECDDICQKCPNLAKNQTCLSDNSSVLKLDELALSLLNLELNQATTFDTLKKHLEKTLTKDLFNEICKDCSWFKNNFCTYENFNVIKSNY